MAIIIALTIHEAAHLFAALILNIKFKKVKITLFGFNINANLENISLIRKILLFIAGPLSNVAVFIVLTDTNYFLFAKINLFLACINLVPIVPLDGGNICKSILEKYVNYQTVCRYMIMTNSFFIVCFLIIIKIYKNYLYFILILMALKGILEENRHLLEKSIRHSLHKFKKMR